MCLFKKNFKADCVILVDVLTGVQSFLMYSVNEGIRGLSLDPSDNAEVLMPVTGTTFAMGLDYHAGMLFCF